MSAAQIRQRLEGILNFLQPHWEFVNCHMVNYITDKHWQKYVPVALQAEVKNVEDIHACIGEVFGQSKANNYTAFAQFVNETKQQRLENFEEILTSVSALQKMLGKDDKQSKITIKEFMSDKKRHEVEITAELINDLLVSYSMHNTSSTELFVVDAGDGKGYLSSRLALQYKHKVLGIDCNELNTENALERSKKLQRAWNGLTERAKLEQEGITPPRRGRKPQTNTATKHSSDELQTNKLENYKTNAQFITTKLNIPQLLQDTFVLTDKQVMPSYCLTGLHTCGNLAATCLQVFHTQNECKILCNVGCCYHLLKEAFSQQEFFGNKAIASKQTDAGFPMSQFLRAKQLKLGRNARMLAAQSIERTLTAKELPNISLYYRALLEVLICQQDATLKDAIQVGKIRKFNNFQEYLSMCSKKCADLNITAAQTSLCATIEDDYIKHKHYLDLFYLLRMCFAPVLETLILLDRLLYLKELNYEHSYLISVFDAVISPRHFGIIALK